MNTHHLHNLSDEDLVNGLKPVFNHPHWAYVEEFLRREQHKQVKAMSHSDTLLTIGRAQGKFAAYQTLSQLRNTLHNLRK